jgi:hypothetical protein
MDEHAPAAVIERWAGRKRRLYPADGNVHTDSIFSTCIHTNRWFHPWLCLCHPEPGGDSAGDDFWDCNANTYAETGWVEPVETRWQGRQVRFELSLVAASGGRGSGIRSEKTQADCAGHQRLSVENPRQEAESARSQVETGSGG